MTHHARNELIASLLADAPLLRLLVSALLAGEEAYGLHPYGVVELHYAPGQVKSDLRVGLARRKATTVV